MSVSLSFRYRVAKQAVQCSGAHPHIRPSLQPRVYHVASINHHLHRKHTPDKLARGQVATRPLTPQNEVGSAGGRGQSTCVGRMAVGGGLGRPTAEPRWHRRACVPHGLTARRQLFRRRTSIIHLYTHTHTHKHKPPITDHANGTAHHTRWVSALRSVA